MELSQWLFYGGIAGMTAAAAGGTLLFFLLKGYRKRLRRKLENEYGKDGA